MREIKFRAWDGKRMTTSGIMFNNSTGCVEVPKDASLGGSMTIPYHLMQFTGLTDKNGKEIYEGDILSITEVDEDSVLGVEFNLKGTVTFGGNGKFVSAYPCSFVLHVKEWWHEEGILANRRHEYEIIGNIHENPELI